MARTKHPVFISLEAIPEAELSYLPKLCEEPNELFPKVTRSFLECLAAGKVTIENLGVHLQALEAIAINHEEAVALAITAYEHASVLGLTDLQHGTWFYNLMLVGCDPNAVRQALQYGHDLRDLGFAKTPKLLARKVARRFHSRYSPQTAQ